MNEQATSNVTMTALSFLIIFLIAYCILTYIKMKKDIDFKFETLVVITFALILSIFGVTYAGYLYVNNKQMSDLEQHIQDHNKTITGTLDFIGTDNLGDQHIAYIKHDDDLKKVYLSTLKPENQSLIYTLDRNDDINDRKMKIVYTEYKGNDILLDIKSN